VEGGRKKRCPMRVRFLSGRRGRSWPSINGSALERFLRAPASVGLSRSKYGPLSPPGGESGPYFDLLRPTLAGARKNRSSALRLMLGHERPRLPERNLTRIGQRFFRPPST